MFRRFAEDITFLLIKNKKFDIEDREIYVYGFETLLLNGGLVLMFLIISLILNELSYFFSYLVFFIPLRVFAGGYHSSTSERCFILSNVMYILSALMTKYISFAESKTIIMLLIIIAYGVIISLSPLVNKNNILDKHQIKRNKIIVYILLFIDVIIGVILYRYNHDMLVNECMSIILVTILLIIGKIKSLKFSTKIAE